MLTTTDLLTCDSFIDINDISLQLYADFSRSVLLKRQFHYYFTDDTDIIVSFEEYGIRHLLAIHHIDGSVSRDEFFSTIDTGLTLEDLKQTRAMRQRFKQYKPRIRLFSCIYNTLRCGRVFHCPNGKVVNTVEVYMDYILYREIDTKGFNIGMRYENGRYVPLTILVGKEINKQKYIDGTSEKIVTRLIISDISTQETIETITYSDDFIMSSSKEDR